MIIMCIMITYNNYIAILLMIIMHNNHKRVMCDHITLLHIAILHITIAYDDYTAILLTMIMHNNQSHIIITIVNV